MQEPESIKSAIEVIASNPKVATTMAAVNTTFGATMLLATLQSWVGFVSVCIGCLTGLVVLTYQTLKLVRFWRAKEQ